MIDFHAHLDDQKFDQDLDLVLIRAQNAGIDLIVCPSVNFDSIEKVISISQKYDRILPMIGLHPHFAKEIDFNELESRLRLYLQKHKFLGFGEIGLDYFYDLSFKKEQIELLERQLDLAEKLKMPVVLHIREAFDDLFAVLQNFPRIPYFVWHSFSGNLAQARQFLDDKGFLSFSGMITFKQNDELREVVKFVPPERIFIETDSPYLTPEPLRGKRNEPMYVSLVYQKVSELKKIDLPDLKEIVKINLQNVFAHFFKQ